MKTTMSTAAATIGPLSSPRHRSVPAETALALHGSDTVGPSEPALSPGLRTFLAKGPGYWTDVEGADDYPTLPAPPSPPAAPAASPCLHANPTGTFTIVEGPPSEGLKAFLAKPDDYWTNPDYS